MSKEEKSHSITVLADLGVEGFLEDNKSFILHDQNISNVFQTIYRQINPLQDEGLLSYYHSFLKEDSNIEWDTDKNLNIKENLSKLKNNLKEKENSIKKDILIKIQSKQD